MSVCVMIFNDDIFIYGNKGKFPVCNNDINQLIDVSL